MHIMYISYLMIRLYACIVGQRKVLRDTYHLINMNGNMDQVKKKRRPHK